MEIKTKFNLGDEVFKVASFSGTERPDLWDLGTVVGFQITQNGTEVIVRFSGTDRSYPEDELLSEKEAKECVCNLMREYIKKMKREIADCEKQLEDYEKWKNN